MNFVIGKSKLIGFSVLLFMLLVAAFLGGIYFGHIHGATSMSMSFDLTQALENISVLKKLERGEVNGAMKSLDSAIDVQVVGLNLYRQVHMFPPLDRELQNSIPRVLKTIAKNRKARQVKSIEHVQAILDAAEKDERAQSCYRSIEE